MEASTRQRPLKLLPSCLVGESKYVVQYFGSNFYSQDSLELLDLGFKDVVEDRSLVLTCESETALDTENQKVLIYVQDRIYHFLVDTIPLILKFHKMNPELQFVLYYNKPISQVGVETLYDCLVKVLDSIEAKYFFIEIDPAVKHSPVYKIRNYITTDEFLFNIHESLSLLDIKATVELLKELYGVDPDPSPSRKVFLSRQYGNKKFGTVDTKDGSYDDDVRVYEEDKLQEYFRAAGFEIISPEQTFKKLDDQMQFMSGVSVLASVSSSGLVNALFMNPGQRVIEIMAEVVVPLKQKSDDGLLQTRQQIPLEYPPLSFLMGHSHLMIPTNRDADVAIKRLKLAT